MEHQGKAVVAILVTTILIWDGAVNEFKLIRQLLRQLCGELG